MCRDGKIDGDNLDNTSLFGSSGAIMHSCEEGGDDF